MCLHARVFSKKFSFSAKMEKKHEALVKYLASLGRHARWENQRKAMTRPSAFSCHRFKSGRKYVNGVRTSLNGRRKEKKENCCARKKCVENIEVRRGPLRRGDPVNSRDGCVIGAAWISHFPPKLRRRCRGTRWRARRERLLCRRRITRILFSSFLSALLHALLQKICFVIEPTRFIRLQSNFKFDDRPTAKWSLGINILNLN